MRAASPFEPRQPGDQLWFLSSIPGSDSGFCSRTSTRTLHPAGNLLVGPQIKRRKVWLDVGADFFSTNRERMNLKAPIYFSTGLTEKANHYYKLFITWTNQKIRKTFVQRNMFEFKHIKAFDRSYADNPGPMVAAAGGCPNARSRTVTARWLRSFRWSSPRRECCTPVSPCRSSRSGPETRRTW